MPDGRTTLSRASGRSARAHEHDGVLRATDRPLTERWRNFDRVIAGKAVNHSGGKTYRKLFGYRVGDLHVAACPVRLEKKYSWWFVQYREAKLQWEFVWQWGSEGSGRDVEDRSPYQDRQEAGSA